MFPLEPVEKPDPSNEPTPFNLIVTEFAAELTGASDLALEGMRLAILSELDRRNKLARIPEQVVNSAREFEALGGDPEDLRKLI